MINILRDEKTGSLLKELSENRKEYLRNKNLNRKA